MPRYFFNLDPAVSGDHSHVLDLPDEDSARMAAKFVARSFAADNVQSGKLDLSCLLHVTDESGRTVHTLPLSAAVVISGGADRLAAGFAPETEQVA